MPLRGAAAFWLGGRGEFGIGGDKQAKPLRLARAEPVHQVVQVVAVVSRCHGGPGYGSWYPEPDCQDPCFHERTQDEFRGPEPS